MLAIWSLVLGGCDTLDHLIPPPLCADFVEVDAVTGAAELLLDPSDCERGMRLPDRAEYSLLLDRSWEPLIRADADPCNTASQVVLAIDGLAPDDLTVDPTLDPSASEGDFVFGAWMGVTFLARSGSEAQWTTYFRLGHPKDVVTALECLEAQAL